MGSLTKDIPKPLLPAGGVPLIYYALFHAWRWGVQTAVVNLHYLGDRIVNELKNVQALDVRFSREDEILGTAGGIRHALRLFTEERILVLNPDTILFPGREPAWRDGLDAVLGLSPQDERRLETGLAFDGNNVSFSKTGGVFYIGCSLLELGPFRALEPGYAELGNLWREQAARGRLGGFLYDGILLDAGTAESYASLPDEIVPANLESQWNKFLELRSGRWV